MIPSAIDGERDLAAHAPSAQRGRWWARARGLTAGALVLSAAAPFAAEAGWLVDLVANFAAQVGLVAAIAAAWWALRRRWACAGAAMAAVGIVLAALAPGRAAWVTGDLSPETPRLRVVQFNAATPPEQYELNRQIVVEARADVVAIQESAGQMPVGDTLGAEQIRARFPHEARLPKGEPWPGVMLLSRWPVEDFPLTQAEIDEVHPLAVVIRRPAPEGGPFGFLTLQPRSPRTPERWLIGNAQAETVGPIAERMRRQGLPVVLAADLNSAPGAYRSRLITRAAGLRRCKPLFRPAGTYPGAWFWPASIAIDDVCVSSDLKVVKWETAGRGGSDHQAVVVELVAAGRP